MTTLKGKTLFMTGGSRGIGRAIALRAAQDGANIALAAKTGDPHPQLEGTVYSVAKEIEALGGKALPLVVDARDDARLKEAVDEAASTFGGIDILVNNASAIQLSGTLDTPMKRFDLMMSVNARATFAASQACLPYLMKGSNAHILNLSPPLNMDPKWFKAHCAYTMSKYGMSMCVLGMSEEFKNRGVAVNALWPRTTIATAAVNMLGGESFIKASRRPEIMADAAHIILTRDNKEWTGNFFIDDEVLASEGITDLDAYAITPGGHLIPDFFLD
jgi:citronellol/citronellal dehydrogenase